jgi:hypothetical protein
MSAEAFDDLEDLELAELAERIAAAEAGDADAGRELLLEFLGTEEQQEQRDAALAAAGLEELGLLVAYVRDRLGEALEAVDAARDKRLSALQRALRLARPAHRPPWHGDVPEDIARGWLMLDVYRELVEEIDGEVVPIAPGRDPRETLNVALATVAARHGLKTADALKDRLGPDHLEHLLRRVKK